jgi:hypothetical protein
MNPASKNSGFIALISVVIITLILLSTTASLATKGFLDRFNILEGEAKEISAGLASACVESALIKIARDGADYAGGETLAVSDKSCEIISTTHSGGDSTIKAQGIYKKATTNYEVIVDTDDQDITSWKEVTTF